MNNSKQRPQKTVPIDYKNCTFNQLTEIIYYAQEELLGRGTKSRFSLDTLKQKFQKNF